MSARPQAGLPVPRQSQPDWRAMGATVQGFSHIRSGAPNQDAIYWLPEDCSSLPLVMAVADGHGSKKHIRSDKGATLAVQTAINVLRDWLAETRPSDLRLIKRMAEEHLPTALERAWKKAVDDDLAGNPLSAEDITLAGLVGADREALAQHPERFGLYGTTVLAVAVTAEFIIYLQLGDGDILVVPRDGEPTRAVGKRPDLIGNLTTSLCLPDARNHIDVNFQRLEVKPALIMLSTDGYANSFADEANFFKAGADMAKFIHHEGWDAVDSALSLWLKDTSEQGSGDDITVGLLVHLPTVAPSDAATVPLSGEDPDGSVDDRAILLRPAPACDGEAPFVTPPRNRTQARRGLWPMLGLAAAVAISAAGGYALYSLGYRTGQGEQEEKPHESAKVQPEEPSTTPAVLPDATPRTEVRSEMKHPETPPVPPPPKKSQPTKKSPSPQSTH